VALDLPELARTASSTRYPLVDRLPGSMSHLTLLSDRRGQFPLSPSSDMDRRIRLCFAVTLLAVTACRLSDSEPTSGSIVRDSAGIRIVENRAPAWGEAEGWSLSEAPLLEIGVLEGPTPYMFSGIRAPRRLADGSIALIDGSSNELRVFDSTGRHVRSIGREGEFELVHRTGEYRPADLRGIFNDGDVFASAAPPLDSRVRSGARWLTDLLLRFSPEGDNPTQLGEAETTQCDPARDGECASLAYGATGSFVLHDDRIYIGRPDWNEIRVLDSSGELQSRIRGAAPLSPVTETMREEFRDAVSRAIRAGRPNEGSTSPGRPSPRWCPRSTGSWSAPTDTPGSGSFASKMLPSATVRRFPLGPHLFDGRSIGRTGSSSATSRYRSVSESRRSERTTSWESLATSSGWNESRCTRFPDDRRSV